MRKMQRDASVIWHEVECAAYAADLPLWEDLAEAADGAVLDLGCGAGRVTLHLARRGNTVTGLDIEPALVATLDERAEELSASAVLGTAGNFDLGTEFGLVLAPMQLVQLLEDAERRAGCLRCVNAHLKQDGLAAFAIVDGMPAFGDASPPLPDTREVDGWIYSSQPIETIVDAERIRARRLRQTVSPAGELSEEISEDLLRTLDAATLEDEATQAGLRPAGRRTVLPTDDHVGPPAVLFQRES